MEDSKIVELYWRRDETAIRETEAKYGRYLQKIAYNILADIEDCRECTNDTYLKAWNSIPPYKPVALSTYLGKITRQTAITLWRGRNAEKRRQSQYALSLTELAEVLSGGEEPDKTAELQALAASIRTFLLSQSEENRNIFLCRYYYLDTLRDIAASFGMTEAKIKSSLYRIRQNLKTHIESEGFAL